MDEQTVLLDDDCRTELSQIMPNNIGTPSRQLRSMFWTQFRAVFLKNLVLGLRQRKLLIFQLIPILVLFVVAVAIRLSNSYVPPGLSTNYSQVYFSSNVPVWPAVGTGWERYAFSDRTNQAGNLTYDGASTPGLLWWYNNQINYTGYGATLYDLSDYLVPFAEEVDDAINHTRAMYASLPTEYIYCDSDVPQEECRHRFELPVAGISFRVLDKENNTFSYELAAQYEKYQSSIILPFTGYPSPLVYISRINSMIIRWFSDIDRNLSPNYNTHPIFPTFSSVSVTLFNVDATSSVQAQLFMWGLIFSFMVPFFMYKIVLERGQGLIDTATTNGLSSQAFYGSLFLYDIIQYLVITTLLIVLGYAGKLDTIVSMGVPMILGLYVNAFGVLSVSYLFSTIFFSINKALLFGYVWSILTFSGAMVLNCFVLESVVMPPIWYNWYPGFSFFRGIFVLAHHYLYPGLFDSQVVHSTAYMSIVWNFCSSLVIFILALYLEKVLPKKSEGHQKNIFFPCIDLYRFFRPKKGPRSQENYTYIEAEGDVDFDISQLDVDVAKEYHNVQRMSDDSEPVIVRELKKVYPGIDGNPDVVAVRGITLSVKLGECLGILGPNGAGKTTLVNMIVGLLNPTNGDAFISGKSVVSQPSLVQSAVGLCPQFDNLYEDLTVEEHLLFYTRLKGYPIKHEKTHVASLIKEIGLFAQTSQLASALSGGQKRRLSIGIALCGNPSVILLDEPTSGLDPGSRRGVWDVIKQAHSNRTFLLTTHSMEEAEVLCTKICIVSKGQLQCIGDQQHLKSRFGQGYKLDIVYDVNHKEKAISFITSLVPTAKLVSANNAYMSYQIPKGVKLSTLFTKMETKKAQNGILTWGISQSNLEEVFLTLVRQDEIHTGKEKPKNEGE